MSCLALGLTVAPALAVDKTPADMKDRLVRSSTLIGADLQNKTGDDIGQLNDVLVDENTGGQMHAVLAAGGFIGIGDKLTPVAWNKLDVKMNEDGKVNLTTMLDKSTLTSMKSYDQHDWFGKDKTLRQEMPDLGQGKFVRLSQVDDAKLFDKTGTQIGAIKDTVVDTTTGKVAYAVVTFDDSYINKGADQMTMVPWTLVRQSEKDTPGYVLHTDKAKLEGATFFGPNAWPNMNEVTWHKQVYDYYAVSPYYWTSV